jgi:predicted transcriptional regulator
MENKKKNGNNDIKIDYENIDVSNIMDQIKEKIEKQPKIQKPERFEEAEYPGSPSSFPPKQEGPQNSKPKIKKVLLKIMKPFAPVIKLMVLPVHQELRDTIEKLDHANKHLGFLQKRQDQLDKKVDEWASRVGLVYTKLDKANDYIKLLHNLSHNIVVELTKLKIEEENLKLKTRIMEKDFEFLGQREKALEKKVFD